MPRGLRIAQSTNAYAMIAQEIGADAAKDVVEGELTSLAASHRGEWELIIARSYLDHFSPEELESITRDGRRSPYAAKLETEKQKVASSTAKRATPFYTTYVQKALVQAMDRSHALQKKQPLATGSSFMATKIYELVVEYPLPIWAATLEAVTRSHGSRNQVGRQFSMELIPGEESQADWKHLYMIYGLWKTTVGPGGAPLPSGDQPCREVQGMGEFLSARDCRFEDFRKPALRIWALACGDRYLGVRPIVDEPSHWQVLVLCESSPDGPAASGWGADVGAVTLMDVQLLSNTYVRIHHTWRGKRFERSDPSTWPVDERELQEMMRRFSRIRLTYNPDANSVPHPGRDFDPNPGATP